MDIIFYKSTNEVNSFPKSLTNGVTISGSLRSECDILNPVIEFTGIGVDIPYNYCYIPTFKRYYFITEARSIRNNILELSMHVDVLQSWADKILNQYAIIKRNEYINNKKFVDDRVPILPTKKDKKITLDGNIPIVSAYSSNIHYVVGIAGQLGGR